MTQMVVTLEVRWDGKQLVARSHYGEGWRSLTGTPGPYQMATTVPCVDRTDLTQFEIGMFLNSALRDTIDAWVYEQLPLRGSSRSPWVVPPAG